MVEGPDGSPSGEQHAQWCSVLVQWLLSLDCPAQLVSVVSNFDSRRAQDAFDERTRKAFPRLASSNWSVTWLGASLNKVSGYATLSCFPLGSRRRTAFHGSVALLAFRARWKPASRKHRGSCSRHCGRRTSLGIAASIPDRDDIADVLVDTVIGTRTAATSARGVVRIGDEFQIVLTVTRLPSTISSGTVVDALIRSRVKGIASMHVLPVEPAVARTVLHRRAAMQRYTAREGNDAVDNQVALADTTAVLAAIAQRQIVPCRVAVSFAIPELDTRTRCTSCGAARRAVARPGL